MSSHVCASGHSWEPEPGHNTSCPICTMLGGDLMPPPPKKTEPLPRVPGYEVLELIGQGGMGVVYRARQRGLDRLVALKLIQTRLDAFGPRRDEVRTRFQTEAQAIARLSHPNVVQVHEVGEWLPNPEQPPVPFLSLEFVAGGSLTTRLNHGPLAPKASAALLETLARAVQAAHERDVVHRDLKPDNVLMTEDGTPKITDFGLARFVGASADSKTPGPTEPGAILGTPSYMAPEQARPGSAPIGPAADVWALGAILYTCLTGRPPFLAATTVDTLLQVMSEEPVAPSRLNPKVPPDLENVCLKCLQKDPAQRYTSAKELADDVERFRLGHPVHARPVSDLVRLGRWARRNRLTATLSAVLFVTSLAGVAAIYGQYRQELRQRQQAEAALQQTQQLVQGVVRRINDDIRHPEWRIEPFPRELAVDLLRRMDDLQSMLHQQHGATAAVELARSEGWRGHLTWVTAWTDAKPILKGAVVRLESALRLNPSDADLREELARTYHVLALAQDRIGLRPDATRSLLRAVELLGADEELTPTLAGAYQALGRFGLDGGDLTEAEKWTRLAAETWDRAQGRDRDVRWQSARARADFDLADVCSQRGEHANAVVLLEKAWKEQLRLAKQEPANRSLALALSATAVALGNARVRALQIDPNSKLPLANVLLRNPLRQAQSFLDQAREVQSDLVRRSDERLSRDWLRSEIKRGVTTARLLASQRKLSQAIKELEGVVPLVEQFGKTGLGPEGPAEKLHVETLLGVIHATNGQRDKSKEWFARALRTWGGMSDLSNRPMAKDEMGESLYLLAAGLRNLGMINDATLVAESAISYQRIVLARAPASRELRKKLSRSMFELAGSQRHLRQHAEAAATARERAKLWPDDPDELHDAACELCMCSRVAEADKDKRVYLDEALVILKQAVAAGLKGAANMKKDGDFTPLFGHPEFVRLVAEVEKRDLSNQ